MSSTPSKGEVVLVTGISGSGKTVALHALEDVGFFCVDNLPPELLRELVMIERRLGGSRRLAVGVDARSTSLPNLLPLVDELEREGVAIRRVFLDARTDALLRRFAETRRLHPLTGAAGSLTDAIERERALLANLRDVSTVLDTSELRPAQLRAWIRQLLGVDSSSTLTLVFESFAYRKGVPRDADLLFDLRVLPNPHYVPDLKPLTGRDAPVIQFLEAQPEAAELLSQIEAYVRRWLPAFEADRRGYLTVAFGCTGGQHRSVYAAEQLAARFALTHATLTRHRELDAKDTE